MSAGDRIAVSGQTGRQEDDICGLNQTNLSLKDKMKSVYWGTSLHREFEKVGLEALA